MVGSSLTPTFYPQDASLDGKEVTAANLAILNLLKAFVADACQAFDSGDKVRVQQPVPQADFDHGEDLALTLRIQHELEEINDVRLREPVIDASVGSLRDFLNAKNKDAASQQALVDKYCLPTLYGLKRGSVATFTSHGGSAMVQIQAEGQRLIALARVQDLVTACQQGENNENAAPLTGVRRAAWWMHCPRRCPYGPPGICDDRKGHRESQLRYQGAIALCLLQDVAGSSNISRVRSDDPRQQGLSLEAVLFEFLLSRSHIVIP